MSPAGSPHADTDAAPDTPHRLRGTDRGPIRPLAGLLGATLVSLTGTRVSAVALPWFTLVTTGSAAQTGLVAFCEMAPYVLFKALSGPVVDRAGCRVISWSADLSSALCAALIPLLHVLDRLPFWLLLVLVALIGALRGPGDLAKQVMVPESADHSRVPLERATGLSGAAERFASTVGPLLGGVLIALTSPVAGLVVNAVCFALGALFVAVVLPSGMGRPGAGAEPPARDSGDPAATPAKTGTVPARRAVVEREFAAQPSGDGAAEGGGTAGGVVAEDEGARCGAAGTLAAERPPPLGARTDARPGDETAPAPESPESPDAAPPSPSSPPPPPDEGYLDRLRNGYRAVRSDPLLVAITVMLAVTNLLDAALVSVLLPVWAEQNGGGAMAIGWVGGTMGGAAIGGSLIAATMGHRLPRRPVFFAGFLLLGIPRFSVLAIGADLPVVLLVMAVAGFGAGFVNPIIGAVIIGRVRRAMLGRVLSLSSSLAWAGIPLGGLIGGIAVDGLGLTPTLLTAGVLYLLATVVAGLRPEWRQMDADREPGRKKRRSSA